MRKLIQVTTLSRLQQARRGKRITFFGIDISSDIYKYEMYFYIKVPDHIMNMIGNPEEDEFDIGDDHYILRNNRLKIVQQKIGHSISSHIASTITVRKDILNYFKTLKQ